MTKRALRLWDKAALLVLFVLLQTPITSLCQLPDSVSDSAKISLVTVTPGTMVYNVFGHSAIRVLDGTDNFDVLFNYGTFDVTPTFVPDFVRGRLDYSLSVSSTQRSIQHYREENRSVIEQHLALSSTQVNYLYQFLRSNYLPENRYYRYDFFFDNCSTRIRDVFQSVLGDLLSADPIEQDDSFRDLLHPYLQRRPFLSAGIDLVIGSDADRTASQSERAFLPLELLHQLDVTRVGSRMFVTSTDTLFVASPTRTGLSPVWALAGWGLLLVVLIASIRRQRSVNLRRFDSALFVVSGLAGLTILLLWFATDHVVTDANLNIAWTLPTNIALGVAILLRREERWTRVYLIGYAAILSVILLGWAFWYQDLPNLLLPIVALLLLRTVGRIVYNGAKHRQVIDRN